MFKSRPGWSLRARRPRQERHQQPQQVLLLLPEGKRVRRRQNLSDL